MSVAVDASDQIVLVGDFTDHVVLGGLELTGAGSWEAFVARLSPEGAGLWANRIGGALHDEGLSVAVGEGGDVWAGAYFEGSVEVGGEVFAGTADRNMLLVNYAPNGLKRWARAFPSQGNAMSNGLARGPNQGVFAVGNFVGSLDLGTGPLQSAGGMDIFLALLGWDP